MSKFFIQRPVFAWVIAILIMLGGLMAIVGLPVAQYPDIAPPQVTINASYNGAAAETIDSTVTQVIEQSMKGIDGLSYMSASSDSSGGVQVTLTFKAGVNPDLAQVQAQNRLQQALPRLPQSVQKSGVSVNKSSSSFLMVVGLVSQDGRMSSADLDDYVSSNILGQLSRVDGVGSVQLFGAPYAMRIWLNPDKLYSYKLNPSDVSDAISAQNAEVSAGQAGATPSVKGQKLNVTVTAQSLLHTPEQFGEILLRTDKNGASVYLKDVARIELGQESYDQRTRYNGKPSTGVALNLAKGANALATADAVRAEIKRLEKFYPPGVKTIYAFDTTPVVRISIHEVIKTLLEAIVLVFLVMYLFLQNLRATLIPTIAVPVVLLGTFGILYACGYSINTLTMFGVVLAIGLLVDDAIVVVENVERVMSEQGLPPREATQQSMAQITGALVGVGLVLSAVFVPMAFFGGSTGVIYRQFSITIVSAMALSVLVALILTPALCASLLKPVEKDHEKHHRGFFGWFNRQFERGTHRYQGLVARVLQRTARFSLLYLGIVVIMALLFWRLPTSFLPDEDQGVLYVQVQLPANATQESTLKVLKKVEDHFLHDEHRTVESVFSVAGFGFAGNGQNTGMAFVMLKDWDQRQQSELKVQAVADRATAAFSRILEAQVYAMVPPAVMDLGNSTGFDFELQDQAGLGHQKLMLARDQLLLMAAQDPMLQNVRPNGMDDTPLYRVDVDKKRAGALGLNMDSINGVLAATWGGSYINDFLDKGETKKVYMQSDAPYRMQPQDINRWYVRNSGGEMVPFSAFSQGHWAYASPRLERYAGVPAVEITGQATPGFSSGQAMQQMEQMAAKLPDGFGFSWTGQSYQERLAGSQSLSLYALSLLVVFLCLAALYESWSVPLSVILVVPLGVVGALLATWMRGLSNDVYFQVGLLTTIGLASKNAILIVEFAKVLQEQGHGLIEATVEAARQRLRPILMTSLAFGLGVLPLALSNGAGSGSQNAIGTGVLGGMLASTVLGIFLIPLFFVQVRRLGQPASRTPAAPTGEQAE